MSGVFGPNASAAFARAAERAKKVLIPGDRVTLGSKCTGGCQTVTFAYFSNHLGVPGNNGTTFSSRSLDDLSPWNITKVNGKPVTFRDEPGQIAVDGDIARFGAERVQRRRKSFRLLEGANQ